MNVKLISFSAPSPEMPVEIEDAQDLIAFCARVSNPSNQLNTDTSEKLIRYLVNNKHWSPLEMVSACIEIETTRDIARQILRHRSFSFQEFSQRYADPTKDLDFVLREARLQDKTNRQNSVEISGLTLTEQNLIEQWKWKQRDVNCDISVKLIDHGYRQLNVSCSDLVLTAINAQLSNHRINCCAGAIGVKITAIFI